MDDVVTVGTFVVLSTARYYDENFPLAGFAGCQPATFPIATICAHRGKLDRSSTRMLPRGRSKVRTILAIPPEKGTECQSILSFVVVLWWSSGLITKLKFDQRRFLATSLSKGGK